MILSGSECHEF